MLGGTRRRRKRRRGRGMGRMRVSQTPVDMVLTYLHPF